MGLDAWIVAVKDNERRRLLDWRGYREINSHIGNLFYLQHPELRDDPEDPFNGGITILTKEDLVELLQLIMDDEFDVDFYSDADRSQTLAKLRNALKMAKDGYTIQYLCSY